LEGVAFLTRPPLRGRSLGALSATLWFPFRLRRCVNRFLRFSHALNAASELAGSSLRVLKRFGRRHSRQAVPNRDQTLGGPTGGQNREFVRSGKRLRAGSDYGLGLVRGGECGDVVFCIDGERRQSLISGAANPRQDMDHSYLLEKQGNSDLNRPEAKGWRSVHSCGQLRTGENR
jgi:hypothetical protein